ncbi:MAG: hypothetical protein JWQ76_1645 [Ramlibacter sp.]|nr:hypothetical protein [Ramlibacter sp.]
MRFARVTTWAWWVCLAAAPTACLAGGANAGFEIRVTLHSGAGIPAGGNTPPGAGDPGQGAVCTSQTRGNDRTAMIEVLCAVGPFVSIAPAPGQSFESTTDEPWRYDFGPRASLRRASFAALTSPARELDSGTLTALQVTNASGDGSALEMLVSF